MGTGFNGGALCSFNCLGDMLTICAKLIQIPESLEQLGGGARNFSFGVRNLETGHIRRISLCGSKLNSRRRKRVLWEATPN